MVCKAHTCVRLLSCRQGPGLEALCPAKAEQKAQNLTRVFCLFSRKATLADIVEQLQEKEAGPGLPAGVVS